MRSSRLEGKAVKRGFARHLEGWQLGAIAIFLAGSVAVLVVPRPVEKMELPEPWVDGRALRVTEREDDRLARLAEREKLDLDVRLIGSLFREYGKGDATGDETAVDARDRLARAVAPAMEHGDELLRLRAYQLRQFVVAVRAWEATGVESDDLKELGGSFVRAMRRNDRSVGRHIKMDEAALRATFKLRWNEIVGLEGGSFALTLDELRAMYRFLLKHPAAPVDEKAPRGLVEAFGDQFRLKKIDELARIDPSFPADLARGVLHFRLGKYGLALQEIQRHLDARPDGPLALRAQNYLDAALAHARLEQM